MFDLKFMVSELSSKCSTVNFSNIKAKKLSYALHFDKVRRGQLSKILVF